MLDAAEGERFEEAAQLRDAMRTVQTLHDRQQKMATAELGHRDVFGLKLGPAGVVVQVFQVRERPRRRAHRARDRGRRSSASSEGEVLEAAIQQFYELRGAPPEIHVPARARRARGARELAVRARRAARADRRAAARREARPRRAREPQRRAGVPDAVQPERRPRSTTRSRRCSTVLALPALPRRIECFDISTIQGSETVASMVVCEDGRMRRGGVSEVPDQAMRRRAVRSASSATTSPPCTKSCCGAIASCSSRAGRFPI